MILVGFLLFDLFSDWVDGDLQLSVEWTLKKVCAYFSDTFGPLGFKAQPSQSPRGLSATPWPSHEQRDFHVKHSVAETLGCLRSNVAHIGPGFHG